VLKNQARRAVDASRRRRLRVDADGLGDTALGLASRPLRP